MNLAEFEKVFLEKMSEVSLTVDPAHDLLHLKRVVQTAKKLCVLEKAKIEVVLPAAWFHDMILIAKNDPRRVHASQLSAGAAIEFLRKHNYPQQHLKEIAHAIEAHSFSAGIPPMTIEAQIVQDADRLDALGAIGIARCFATAGLLKRSFYSEDDPFCNSRPADDSLFTVDHFYMKLFTLVDTLKTNAGQIEGEKRLKVMKKFLDDLNLEIKYHLPQ